MYFQVPASSKSSFASDATGICRVGMGITRHEADRATIDIKFRGSTGDYQEEGTRVRYSAEENSSEINFARSFKVKPIKFRRCVSEEALKGVRQP